MDLENEPILFFDGECGLCSRSVRFLMHRDRSGFLFYAPLQGDTAEQILDSKLRASLSTAVYRRADGKILLRSDAVLHALIDINSRWRFLARLALWIPQSWRNGVYDWVAARRESLSSNKACELPSPEKNQRFLS